MLDFLLISCAAAVGGGLAGWGFARLSSSLILLHIRELEHALNDVDRILYRETKRRASAARFEGDQELDEIVQKELQKASPEPPWVPGWPTGKKFTGRPKEG